MARFGRMGAAPRRSLAQTVATVTAGTVAVGVAGLFAYWVRERTYASAEYETIRKDGSFSVRRYSPMVVATTDANGVLHDALDTGFRRLFGYISGKRRAASEDQSAIAMTTPVVAVPGDHPGGWKVRFGMPPGEFPSTLPKPGNDVAIEELPGRLIAAIRFAGRDTDATAVAERRDDLLAWVRLQGLSPVGEPEFAGYNAPMIPGPVRRNEWWIEIAEPAAA
jgi:hypothetical protein